MGAPVIPHDELLSILRSHGYTELSVGLARRIEQEVLHRVGERQASGYDLASGVVLPLADYEAEFISNVRTVVAGIRASVVQEERERLARVLPEWLKKGG